MDHFVTPAIRSTLGICRWRWESAFSPVDLVLHFWSRRTGFLFIGLFFAKKKRFGKARENRIAPISRRCRASGRRFGREFLQLVANPNGDKRSREKVLSGSSGWPNYRSQSHWTRALLAPHFFCP